MAVSYRNRVRLAAALAVVAAVAAGFAGGRIVRLGEPGEDFWLVFPALLAICALGFAASLPWWRRLDDMQKAGHLVSWYWGGMGGGIATIMALCAATGVHSALSKGAMYVVIGQAVAFVLFLAGWRLRHRGAPA